MGITNVDALEVGGVPTMGMSGLPLTIGNVIFVDPVNGNDGNQGSADEPMQTLYGGFYRARDGKNDVIVLVGNGQASGSARLSLANAQVWNSAVTAGTLVWNKNAVHLVGMAAPTQVAQRARIAPPTGTYTQATFGSGNFVTVSGQGCIFSNISLFNGFSTGGVNQICWTDTGGRNYYNNVNFGGMGDAASAADTGSRCLKISGTTGENTFNNCVIGLDTVDRSVANASLEFAGGTPRNNFIDCLFPMRATNAGVLSILGSAAACIDRYQRFLRCAFINAMGSGATAQTVIASLPASAGGLLFFDQCTFIGNASTNWGDANAMAQSYINMSAISASGGGIGTNPT